ARPGSVRLGQWGLTGRGISGASERGRRRGSLRRMLAVRKMPDSGRRRAMSANADALIAQYIEENPLRPGAADARLKDFGVAVRALISYLTRAVGGDVAQAAADFEVPGAAVEAARAYYERHRAPIDARIAVSAA